MATNVVVIDSTARRTVVKTTPGKYLSDVLAEACAKLGADPSQYGLKHNNKAVDLSRTMRLSGLSSGAKLELVQLSKSAGVVNVALQLPESEAQSAASARLTDKFPSTTTLWLLLRKFEAGVAGSSVARNLTARGVPSAGSDAGRLFYEQPVLNIMGRELASFTELQRSLSQLGFNNGNVLIKLTFKPSDTPLEEAMSQIQSYFDEADPQPAQEEPSAGTEEHPASDEPQKPKIQPEWLEDQDMKDVEGPSASQSVPVDNEQTETQTVQSPPPAEPTATVSDRAVSVFRPPSSSGPAPVAHNEADYVPTVEHAQAHQKLLQQESRNKRLPTDAEILARQKELREELEKIDSVEIKIRFPDQSAVSSKFGQADTAASLYDFVRQCLDGHLRKEPFVLRNPGVRDKTGGAIADDGKRLIINLQLKGRVLVVFGWDDKASVSARGTKQVLKPELRQQAREYVPPAPQTTGPADDQDKGVTVDLGPKKESNEGGGVKGKMPKWLKGLGKK